MSANDTAPLFSLKEKNQGKKYEISDFYTDENEKKSSSESLMAHSLRYFFRGA